MDVKSYEKFTEFTLHFSSAGEHRSPVDRPAFGKKPFPVELSPTLGS